MSGGKEVRIVALLVIDVAFFLLELIIGYAVHSLALIADSFHMLNDIVSLLVALWAVNVAKNRDPDASYTYGWKRAEILGALINAVFLIALCVSILIEAIQRLFEPQEITNPKLVLYVGSAGLLSNILGLFLFHDHGHGHGHGHSHFHSEDTHLAQEGQIPEHGTNNGSAMKSGHSHSHSDPVSDSETCDINKFLPAAVVEHYIESPVNETSPLINDHKKNSHSEIEVSRNERPSQQSLNMNGVFIHVLGDALGNIGVILSAWFIWKTDYTWRFYADPLISLVITCIIFSSALPLSRKASRILLQATPSSISADDVQMEILAIPGVLSVHDFHIWNLTETFSIASIHVQIDCNQDTYLETAKLIRYIFHKYGIHSATVQPEFVGAKNVSDDSYRNFSRIAGGGLGSSTSIIGTEEDQGNKDYPFPYGATTNQTGCLVDDAANCNSDNCLT